MGSKGFSPIIIILAIILLTLLGFFGYQSFQTAWQKGSANVATHQLSTPGPTISCSSPILEEIPQYVNGNLKISFGGKLPIEMKQKIIDSIVNRPASLFKDIKEFGVTSSRIEGDWALLSIGAKGEPGSQCFSSETLFGCTGTIIAKKISCREWDVAIVGSENYKKLISESPDTFLSSAAKRVFLQESQTTSQ